MILLETYLTVGALLLMLSVLASKATGRLGVPALLVFLAVGILGGSEGVVPFFTGQGGIYFDSPLITATLGTVCLVMILFSGGLDTTWKEIRPVVRSGLLLATAGVLVTCGATGLFAKLVLGFSWTEGALLGAIMSSTDAAAVFTILRAKSIHLKGQLKPLLEFESGSNDPMAVFLTISLIGLLKDQESTLLMLVLKFIQQMGIGALMGFAAGKGTVQLLNQLKLEFEGLYPVMSIASVIFTFGISQFLGGSGFLAVYLMGLLMGRENFIHKKSLTLFHDGISWLGTISMFLALGLLVFPSRLLPVAPQGLLLSVFLIFIARPLAVYISLFRSPFGFREKTLISWIGLRGSAPIVLATFPFLHGVDKADLIFNLIFFIVLTSVLFQGTSIPFIAKWLKLESPARPKFRYPIEFVPTENLKTNLIEVEVPVHSSAIGKPIIELKLPKEALIVLIQRKENAIVPRGSTHIEHNDKLLVLAEPKALLQIREILAATPV